MSKPLYDRIMQFNNAAKARFCMPGHSGNRKVGDLYSLAQMDWTEVEGLDNLLRSEGVIADSEKLLASSYGYAHALMLTGGSTCAMQISMALAKERGNSVIAIGDMHKSFYSSARLFGVKAYTYRNIDEAKRSSSKDASCVFVTSPDYFGNLSPLDSVMKFARERHALLIVDEAHSAHFPYSELLPDNASEYADVAFASMHKTLPVYGGGAVLFANDKELYGSCRRLRADIHSTSPNYLVMASMDYANWHMRKNGNALYSKVKEAIDMFKAINAVGHVEENDDFTRLVLKIDGADCHDVLGGLASRGIYGEMAYGDKLVFIVTPFNCVELELLAKTLRQIPLRKCDRIMDDVDFGMERADKDGATIFLEQSEIEGEVCALDIGIYPPGTPLIKRGDVFNAKSINFIKKYSSRLFGLDCGKVGVLK